MKKNRFLFSSSHPSVSVTISTIPQWNLSSTGVKNNNAILFHMSDSADHYELEYGFADMDFADLRHTQKAQPVDSMFYGMIHTGGTSLLGYLFQYNPVNSTFTKKSILKLPVKR